MSPSAERITHHTGSVVDGGDALSHDVTLHRAYFVAILPQPRISAHNSRPSEDTASIPSLDNTLSTLLFVVTVLLYWMYTMSTTITHLTTVTDILRSEYGITPIAVWESYAAPRQRQ
jgi:hypothetical protein